MRFLSIYTTIERNVPPTQDEMDRMNKLIADSMARGDLLSTEGCLPTALGARVSKHGTKVTVVDGPFSEAKEVVGGFAILNANSKEEAIEMAKEFLAVAGHDGTCELRLLYDPPTPEINARHQASSIAQQWQAANT